MSDSIGRALRAAREKRQLTLAHVSETTRIRSHYLEALENDDLSAMPSAAQARGFLKIYTEFLGIDLTTLINPAAGALPPAAPTAGAHEAAEPVPEEKPGGPNLLSRIRQGIASRLARRPESAGRTGEDDHARPSGTAEAAPANAELHPADKKKAPL